jgi:hypothetical protein
VFSAFRSVIIVTAIPTTGTVVAITVDSRNPQPNDYAPALAPSAGAFI